MKPFVLLLSMAAFLGAAVAQNPPSSATPPASGSAAAPKPGTAMTGKPAGASGAAPASAITPPWIKLPPGIPHAVHGPVKIALALHYEDIKVGTGALGESGKLWHIKYTGWRAADGVKFDSWDDHKKPKIGPDGKPVVGADGKPEMSDPEPLEFPQGMGRVIPGFDYGLDGMRIGGKRRIFIPWQLAYGTRTMPDRPDHPGIPAKSDLIFDVELVEVTDMPAPPQRPTMPPHPMAPPAPHPATPGTPGAAPAPGSTPNPAPGSPSAPGTPSATPNPAAPPSTPNPQAPPASTQQPSTPQAQQQ